MGIIGSRWSQALAALFLCASWVTAAAGQTIPPLTGAVNDFAKVIDADSRGAMESLIRSLEQASGDVVVVATIDTFAPAADIREYADKMFENGGRGVGQRGKDNGALILLAVKDRQVWVEVGYDLEQFITDGFAGETSRQYMIPEFRTGTYGSGLLAGTSRIIGRIAGGRNITLQGVRPERRAKTSRRHSGGLIVFALIIIVLKLIGGGLGGRRRFGGGWNSGIGPFGGGLGGGFGSGGGFGGGGFGGGFGGFGGGRSGGGGGGGSW